jgi:hypothetical protein
LKLDVRERGDLTVVLAHPQSQAQKFWEFPVSNESQDSPLWRGLVHRARETPSTLTAPSRSRKATIVMATGKKVVYRDSKNGEFITRREADRKDPATWEREHVKNPSPKK